MIQRYLGETILRLNGGFPIVAITGPRQSGKTTLSRASFPDKPYVSLEEPDTRSHALDDPRGFLKQFSNGAILDEAQRAPELFSYLQSHVDLDGRMGLFVLTDSQQFGLRAGITQSLAGRVGLVTLLPFAFGELGDAGKTLDSMEATLFTGSFPPLYDRPVTASDWYPRYIATYLERDLHQLIHVRDLHTFQTFLRMCAARVGQVLNLSSLAADCGITHNTARAWISVLEASYILFLLQPYHRNFNKRLIKAPKLYFYDTGIVASLMGIEDERHLAVHAMRGQIFENWIIAELLKGRMNRGLPSNLFFWRDRAGLEIDVIAEHGETLQPMEIRSGATVAADFFTGLRRWCDLSGGCAGDPPILFHGGEGDSVRHGVAVRSWRAIGEIATQV
jgi:predicted AAA+ superfamily ATPase